MATGTGSGSPALAPEGVLAAELLATIRAATGDAQAAVWSDAELLTFLNEGVREYSQHRPRVDEVVIPTAAAEQTYQLPVPAAGLLGVVYTPPDGNPVRLYRLGYKNAHFPGSQVYDFLGRRDMTIAPLVQIGILPAEGGSLTVRFWRPHDARLTAASPVTVPESHHHVLVHYVVYAATRYLMQKEQANPTSSSSLLMSQLAANMRRLEMTYLNAINRLLVQEQGEGSMVSWTNHD